MRRGAAPGAEAVRVSADVVSLVLGRDAGTDLVLDPNIRAVGFTGSVGGGRALHDLASIRHSTDPVLWRAWCIESVSRLPVRRREPANEIATGLANSFTLGVGQFCTKPGLAFIPAGEPG